MQPNGTDKAAMARIEEVAVGKLAEDPANVRVHGERNIEAIAASLKRFGQQAPVVYIRRGRKRLVIKGNGVLAAARRLGWTHLAAVESALEGADATAFAIADNRTTDLSEFDAALVAAQLQDLEESEYDFEVTGFCDEELQDLLDEIEADDDRAIAADRAGRKRGERTTLIVIGHLKFEVPRSAFDRWISAIEQKIGNDPDKVVKEIKRRLKL